MAEKEIILKTKKIKALEDYIEQIQKTGKVDTAELDKVKHKLDLEQKKLETALAAEIGTERMEE